MRDSLFRTNALYTRPGCGLEIRVTSLGGDLFYIFNIDTRGELFKVLGSFIN